MSRNFAFIDSQNLNLAIRSLGWSLDFKRFRVYLRDKYEVERAFLFMGYIAGNWKLYKFLAESGYEIIFKPVVTKGSIIKGNCDAELVLHCMIQYQNYDKALIISGDGDFYCLIDYLLKKGKLLKVGIPNHRKYSVLLKGFLKQSFFVSYLKKKLEHKKR
jgi:uncharacterized LabA/DUF88 family protein